MSKFRVRFAPSPTGFLHIGGARTALFNWLFARHHGGTFILRIEDTDEVRSTLESVDAITDGMKWMGLDWDEGPYVEQHHDHSKEVTAADQKGKFGPYFQMVRHSQGNYSKHIEKLLADGKAYYCYCTPEELDEMRRSAQLAKRPPMYDRRCRDLSAEQRKEREAQGKKKVVRFKMPADGTTVVKDLVRGDVSFENKLLQDLVIQKTSGVPTYNFACVIDDHDMEMTHVIRAEEHLSNTPSQQCMYEALGWKPPLFAHLSMILGPDGSKLSKRHGATSVQEYRDQGFLPEALRNYLALLGWGTAESQDIFEGDELVKKFDLDRCQKNPATFDHAKLLWMNGEYLRKLTPAQVLDKAKPFLEKAGLSGVPREQLEKAFTLEREKVKLLAEVPKLVDFFFKDVAFDQPSVDKTLKPAGVRPLLEGLIEEIKNSSNGFTAKDIEALLKGYAVKKGVKNGAVFHPIRVAVSGRTQGPSLFEMLELLGKDTVLKRAQAALPLATP